MVCIFYVQNVVKIIMKPGTVEIRNNSSVISVDTTVTSPDAVDPSRDSAMMPYIPRRAIIYLDCQITYMQNAICSAVTA